MSRQQLLLQGGCAKQQLPQRAGQAQLVLADDSCCSSTSALQAVRTAGFISRALTNSLFTRFRHLPAAADRSVSFHARFGAYFRTRTPRQGRDLAYAPFTAELLVAGSAPEVWRLSLAEGRFMSPLPAKSPGINAVGAWLRWAGGKAKAGCVQRICVLATSGLCATHAHVWGEAVLPAGICLHRLGVLVVLFSAMYVCGGCYLCTLPMLLTVVLVPSCWRCQA